MAALTLFKVAVSTGQVIQSQIRCNDNYEQRSFEYSEVGGRGLLQNTTPYSEERVSKILRSLNIR